MTTTSQSKDLYIVSAKQAIRRLVETAPADLSNGEFISLSMAARNAIDVAHRLGSHETEAIIAEYHAARALHADERETRKDRRKSRQRSRHANKRARDAMNALTYAVQNNEQATLSPEQLLHLTRLHDRGLIELTELTTGRYGDPILVPSYADDGQMHYDADGLPSLTEEDELEWLPFYRVRLLKSMS